MKKILLSAMIAAFSMAAVNAQEVSERKQDKPQLQEKQKGHSKGDWAGLNLSEEQKAKKKALKEAHQLEMEELKKQNISEEKMEALRKEHHDQLLSILTDEQKDQLDKIKEERHDMKEKKALAEQKNASSGSSKVEIAAKIKVIQQDETLTAEQKKEKTQLLVEQLKASNNKPGLSEEELNKLKEKKKHDLGKKASN